MSATHHAHEIIDCPRCHKPYLAMFYGLCDRCVAELAERATVQVAIRNLIRGWRWA